jgi:hypothetical protein
MIHLAYHHYKGFPRTDINLECLVRIRAGPAVADPIGADVIWIEAP